MEDVVTLDLAYLEISESSRIELGKVARIGEDKEFLSINKQWRDKTGTWKYGKGFWIPFEEAYNLAMALVGLSGMEFD